MVAVRNPLISSKIGALTLLVLALAPLAEAADESGTALPRYRLHVGDELIYRGESVFEYEGGKFVTRDSWRVWVARENADGSFHLIIRKGTARSQQAATAKNQAPDRPENATFAWCDLFSNGRIVENDSLGYHLSLSGLFARLPESVAESRDGWSSYDPKTSETAKCRMLPEPTAERCEFEVVRESPMNAIYGSENQAVVTFDMGRGLPEKISSTSRQTYGFDGKGSGSTEFVEVKTAGVDAVAVLADEAARYFAANAAYEKACEREDLEASELEAAIDQAVAELRNVRDTLKAPELKELIDEQLAKQKNMLKYALESAAERKAILGTPSDEWATTDLAGEKHALKDYRGKVLVLDFWYRGCGWCIRAMPQMKEIAAHFAGQSVVVFGMNTDRDEKDAEFVVDKMGLNYPNLKATGLPEKYKVRGFPTLIILDQEGVVRDIHVGYSADLKEKVVKSVERLLTAKP